VADPIDPHPKRQGRPRLDDGRSEVRDCPRHGRAPFRRFRDGGGRFRWRCTRCVGEAVTRRHRKVKETLVALAGGHCASCGYDRCLANMHFHHVDPSKKSFAMTVARGKSLATYMQEARKCVLVCANCHGEIEAGIRPCPPLSVCWGADAA